MDARDLRRLAALPAGAAAAGEIELLRAPDEIAAAERAAAERLRARGQPAEWSRVGTVFEDQHLAVHRDAVRFPSGALGTYLSVGPPAWERVGVQGVVWDGARYLMLRNFRHATRRWEWSFPRGLVDEDASPREHALREVREELGQLRVRGLTLLGRAAPDSGMLSTEIEHWRVEVAPAERLDQLASDPEAFEAIEGVRAFTPEQLWTLLASGAGLDGIAVTGFALAEAHRRVAQP